MSICGTLSQRGTVRCPECSTFHSGIHLEERDAPSPEEELHRENWIRLTIP